MANSVLPTLRVQATSAAAACCRALLRWERSDTAEAQTPRRLPPSQPNKRAK
jgi:hypothetical protein